ncbi:MAG TPA: prolyl oligopeptidase family serine peptidase [Planctomycetota bacterium]|nr:prolyl oligopeptidase family serine peptidase [Planctomycetota bacterium]
MISLLVLLSLQDDPAVLKAEAEPRKMLYRYLEGECAAKFEERRKAVAALKTPEEVKARQDALRAKFIEALGGLPERTPLNAKLAGTLKGEGFRVEKVIYESRPDHHVTGSLYLPEGKGPFPGVLVPCGHSDKGKAEEAYQRISILLVKNGFAVLCYDPIGQGERMQLLTPEGKPAIKGNTTEHSLVEVAALPVGWSTASFRIWDGLRSLDYLASRPEVDPQRLGCTGNSGGGTMTAYLMALDDRIACAAPSCYITTLERLFATIGPQDGEQNITGQVAFGMEQTDYVTMRAPRPTLICTATRDFFDIQGSWTTFREAKRTYALLGHAERVDLIEYPDTHGFSKPRREAATRWMRRWLLGVDDAPVELDGPVFREEELWCTPRGQVLAELKGKSVFDLIRARSRKLAEGRMGVDVESLGRLLARGAADFTAAPASTSRPVEGHPDRRVASRVWTTASKLAVPARLYSGPDPIHRPVVVLGREEDSKLSMEWALKGSPGVVVDLPGTGETAPDEKPGPLGRDWKEAFLAIHLGRSLLELRTDAARTVCASDPPDVLVGLGPMAPVALHVAVLNPKVRQTVLDGMVISWSAVAESGESRNQLAGMVPEALAFYDLPDLAAALAPRPLTIRRPVDSMGKPVGQEELERTYQKAREAYHAAGADKSLVLEARP